MAGNYKYVTLRDPVTGDFLIPRGMGGLSYEIVNGETTPPFDLKINADTLDGKHASDFAESTHTHDASTISAGTLGGKVVANASAASKLTEKQVRNIYAGTVDIGAGADLPAGDIYLVYDEPEEA